jgi:branched-chain amino acid transport system substrate-binding protein
MKLTRILKSRYKAITLVLAISLPLLLNGCAKQQTETNAGASAEAAKPIKIGLLGSLSGANAPIGEQIRDGIVLAVEQYGPVKGRPVELVIEDTTGNPEIAVSKATKLVEKDGVIAIIGISYSNEMLALEAVSDRLKVPIVTTNGPASDITGKNLTRWSFRACASDDFTANALIKRLEQEPALKNGKWYILGSDFAYSRSSAKAARGTGINVIEEVFAPVENTDWAPQITAIQNARPDYLFAPIVAGVPQLQFFRQARDFGLLKQVKVYGGGLPEWQNKDIGDILLDLNVIAKTTCWSNEDTIPALKTFNEAFYKKYNRTPTFQSITSGAGAQFFLKAVEKAPEVEPEAIRTALEGLTADTIVGSVTMRAKDHQLLVPMYTGKTVKLKEPKYGTEYGFEIEKEYTGEELAPKV